MNKINNNFNLLVNREQGQLFDVRENKLVTLSLIQKIRYIFQKSYREAVKARLKPLVSSLVGRVTDESQIQSLKRLPLTIFDRTALSPNFINSLTPPLTKETDDDAMNVMIQKIKLAIRLGVRPQRPGEGCSGSYFMKDLAGTKLAIFKPMDEEVLSSNTPTFSSKVKRLIYKYLPFWPTNVFCMNGAGYLAEEAASRMSEALGLQTVPFTRIVHLVHHDFHYSTKEKTQSPLPEKVGSLQTFIEGSETAEVALGIRNETRFVPIFAKWFLNRPEKREFLFNRFTQEEFEKFAIIDFIVGNLDRHFGNWMLTKNEIKAIDNGYAMPEDHSSTIRTNQHLWRILPQAEKPFGEAAREIVKNLRAENLPEMLSAHKLINAKQRKSLEERIAVVVHYVENELTPFELGSIKSPKDFQKALQTIAASKVPEQI